MTTVNAYDDREALSVEECATATGISRAEIYVHIGSGKLPSVKLGRRRLVLLQSLREWLAMLERQTAGNDDLHHRDREAASKARKALKPRGSRGQES